jgi:hypothetical protein
VVMDEMDVPGWVEYVVIALVVDDCEKDGW